VNATKITIRIIIIKQQQSQQQQSQQQQQQQQQQRQQQKTKLSTLGPGTSLANWHTSTVDEQTNGSALTRVLISMTRWRHG
jgi:transcription initiation factor TFIID subunit TAF12